MASAPTDASPPSPHRTPGVGHGQGAATGPGPGPGLGSGSGFAPMQAPPVSVSIGSAGADAVIKLTRGHSCVLCQQRKVRCDKNKPCANCVKAGVECRVVPPQPPRRRKKKPHERELIDRLRRYETLLSQAGVSFEPIAHELRPSDLGNGDEVDELEQNLGGLKTSPGSHNSDIPNDRQFKSFPYSKEYKAHEDLAHDSSDEEEYERPTIHHAFDKMFDNQDGFPFVIGGSTNTVTDKHPPGMQIIQLWQIYLNNVDPLLKMTHTQSLQSQIIEAGTNPSKIPKPLEALLFGIYFMAITSMQDDEVHSTFGEEKSHLLGKYHAGAQQSLINAGFMRSPDLVVLQAYVMYLLGVREYVDPRSLYCLIGIAVRMAQRLGLHRDGSQFNFQPFELEMRRRLWWQLAIFDKRIAEITGSSITAMSSGEVDCKWPLNINDTDLHQNAKDAPPVYTGPTEMLFVLTRIELITAAAPGGLVTQMGHNATLNPNINHPSSNTHLSPNNIAAVTAAAAASSNKPKVTYSPSPQSPDLVTHMAGHYLPGHDIDGYCQGIEEAYLKHCDPKIPLHYFTILFTRQNLCKLRIIAYLCRTAAGFPTTDAERDALFVEAIHMVELDNVMQTSDALRGFLWYTRMHFPLPGYMFLVHELRQRKTGELADKAWDTIIENHDRRGLMKKIRNPIHVTFGNLFLKAWDARQAAEAQLGRHLSPPKFINMLRQTLAKHTPAPSKTPPGATAAGVPGAGRPTQPPQTPQQQQQLSPSQQQRPQQQNTPDSTATPMSTSDGGGAMAVDEPAMFSTFDSVSPFFVHSALPDLDFGQMDWISMIPELNGLVGMGAFPGGGPVGGLGQGMGVQMPQQHHLQPPPPQQQQQPQSQVRQQQLPLHHVGQQQPTALPPLQQQHLPQHSLPHSHTHLTQHQHQHQLAHQPQPPPPHQQQHPHQHYHRLSLQHQQQ